MNFGRAGTHFTCTQNPEEEKPGHGASPRTHLLARRRACVYVSHCLSTGGVCAGSLKRITGDPRGNSVASLAADRLNSFTPAKKHPAHLPAAFNSADPSDLLHRRRLHQHFPLHSTGLPLYRGEYCQLPGKAHQSCQRRWRAVVLRAGLITGHRPSLPWDLWCLSEPHNTHTHNTALEGK